MFGLWRVAEKELGNVKNVFKYGFGNQYTLELERRCGRVFETRYAVAVNSGTSALHCALVAVGVSPGDEVITTPLTFAASGMCATYVGATPVFADVDPKTFNICSRSIEENITSKTKAIIVVALYGQPAELEDICEVGRRHGIPIIEDNAQCIRGYYRNRLAGSFGDIAIYSFQRSKHVTAGDGGMLATDNAEYAERARKFSCLGYSTLGAETGGHVLRKEEMQHPSFNRHATVGVNYRMPEVIAAILCAQIERVGEFVELRQEIAAEYWSAMERCSFAQAQYCPEHIESARFCFSFALDTRRVSWNEFRGRFVERGGHSYFGAWQLTYKEPVFRGGYEEGLCPVAEDLQPRLVQLKTNFESLEVGKEQARVLKETLADFE